VLVTRTLGAGNAQKKSRIPAALGFNGVETGRYAALANSAVGCDTGCA